MESIRDRLPSITRPLEEDQLENGMLWYKLRVDTAIQIINYMWEELRCARSGRL